MLAPSVDHMARAKTPKPKQTEQINLRVPLELRDALRDGDRVLALLAKVNGEDAPGSSKSMRRFLRLGLDVIFHKVGGRPQSESDWEALEASLLATKKH